MSIKQRWYVCTSHGVMLFKKNKSTISIICFVILIHNNVEWIVLLGQPYKVLVA